MAIHKTSPYINTNVTHTGPSYGYVEKIAEKKETPTPPLLTENDLDEAASSIENLIQDSLDDYENIDLESLSKNIIKLLLKNNSLPNYARQQYEDKISALNSQISILKADLIEAQYKSKKNLHPTVHYSKKEKNIY